MINQEKLIDRMHGVENIIGYKFENIIHLMTAMNRTKVPGKFGGKHNKTYINETYALIGDPIIKIVLSEALLNKGFKTKGEITIIKQNIEDNDTFHIVSQECGLTKYAYNIEHFADDPNLLPNEQVSNNGHDSFIEAITGAIYFDSDFSTAYDWVSKWLFDKLDLEVLK